MGVVVGTGCLRGFPPGLDRINLWALICLNNAGEGEGLGHREG